MTDRNDNCKYLIEVFGGIMCDWVQQNYEKLPPWLNHGRNLKGGFDPREGRYSTCNDRCAKDCPHWELKNN